MDLVDYICSSPDRAMSGASRALKKFLRRGYRMDLTELSDTSIVRRTDKLTSIIPIKHQHKETTLIKIIYRRIL